MCSATMLSVEAIMRQRRVITVALLEMYALVILSSEMLRHGVRCAGARSKLAMYGCDAQVFFEIMAYEALRF